MLIFVNSILHCYNSLQKHQHYELAHFKFNEEKLLNIMSACAIKTRVINSTYYPEISIVSFEEKEYCNFMLMIKVLIL